MRHPNPRRGFTLLELLTAMGISAAVLTIVLRIVILGTQSFTREQGQTYSQFRVRTAIDSVAVDIRTATAVLASTGLPTNDRAITLEVPCQSNSGIVYSGTTMLKDTVAYWHTTDGVLHRRITKGDSTSKRTAGDSVVAQNVSALTITLKDRNGAVVTDVTQAAAVDVSATVTSLNGMQSGTVALTGVRMRNKR